MWPRLRRVRREEKTNTSKSMVVLDNMFGWWCGGDGVVVVWQGLDLPCDLLSHLVLTLTTWHVTQVLSSSSCPSPCCTRCSSCTPPATSVSTQRRSQQTLSSLTRPCGRWDYSELDNIETARTLKKTLKHCWNIINYINRGSHQNKNKCWIFFYFDWWLP